MGCMIRTQAACAATRHTPSAGMADAVDEQQWSADCNELLGQVQATQKEIATLLSRHDSDSGGLCELKEQVDKEVGRVWRAQHGGMPRRMVAHARASTPCCCCGTCVLALQLTELSEDAWRLRMYIELQKMNEQLEQLAVPAGSDGDGDGDGDGEQQEEDASATAAAAGEADAVQAVSGATAATTKQQQQQQQQDELAALDGEIAALDKELAAARAELQGLQTVQGLLQDEVAAACQQLQAPGTEQR
jgi:hypothetical protein